MFYCYRFGFYFVFTFSTNLLLLLFIKEYKLLGKCLFDLFYLKKVKKYLPFCEEIDVFFCSLQPLQDRERQNLFIYPLSAIHPVFIL